MFRLFDTIEICSMSPTAEFGLDPEKELLQHERMFEGSWVGGSTAGGCRNFIDTFGNNPQYRLRLGDSDKDTDDTATCIMSLMQKGRRREQGFLTIGTEKFLTDGRHSVQQRCKHK